MALVGTGSPREGRADRYSQGVLSPPWWKTACSVSLRMLPVTMQPIMASKVPSSAK